MKIQHIFSEPYNHLACGLTGYTSAHKVVILKEGGIFSPPGLCDGISHQHSLYTALVNSCIVLFKNVELRPILLLCNTLPLSG